MKSPYCDPQFLEEKCEVIARLRTVIDMPAPWDVDPDVGRWKRGLGNGPGSEDALNSHMHDWRLWLLSLTTEQLANYQALHPEPHGWGLYDLVLTERVSPEVTTDAGPEVYWDTLEKHYRKVFGVAEQGDGAEPPPSV